jgi:hypothetical protein
MKTKSKTSDAVFFQNTEFSIEFWNNYKAVIIVGKHFTDYPCPVADGSIFFDFPAQIPAYIKSKVKLAYELINRKN